MSEEKISSYSVEKKKEIIEKVKNLHNLDNANAEAIVNSILIDANLDRIIRAPRKKEELTGGIIINNCNDQNT